VPGLEEFRFPDLDHSLVEPNVSDPESRNLSQAQPGAVCQNQHRMQTVGTEGSTRGWKCDRGLKQLPDLRRAEYVRLPLSAAYLPHELVVQSGHDHRWIFALESPRHDSAYLDPRQVQFESGSVLCPSLNENGERLLSGIRLLLQKPIQTKETVFVVGIAETGSSHDGNVRAHCGPQMTAERRQRAEFLQGGDGVRIGQCPHNRRR
jgi:hypothetical protein